MQPVPIAPAPWQSFLIMFGLLAVTIGLLLALAWLTRAWQRLADPAVRARVQERAVRTVRIVRAAATGVHGRSARPNAEKRDGQDVQTVGERSPANPKPEPVSADGELRMAKDDLQKLAHIIVLYARRPNKELAILTATGATKGGSDEYQRWSQRFDEAMGEAAREAAKAKLAETSAAKSTSAAVSAAAAESARPTLGKPTKRLEEAPAT